MPGAGIFLSTSRRYVLDYYAGHNDQEVVLTLDFDSKDIVTGRETLKDREPELSVRQAVIVDYEIVVA